MRRGMSIISKDNMRKQKILIVDDSEMNRSILADMLGKEYEIIEAEDGIEAVTILKKHASEISLVLLDVVMPRMDGFEVLTVMNQSNWIENIPVIMISAENGSAQIQKAYDLGVVDFITRPFDALIVHRRVVNTILLYAKQQKLIEMVADQIYESEQRKNMMIDILSHIVEFRNGESGVHIVHVRTLTELFLKHLAEKTEAYDISAEEISLISTASALHDIGKISIDDKILNKPGKLTVEEFEIMKGHSLAGAEILDNLEFYQQEPLVKTAYDICRWHHERYDGHGYPDGLAGDEIPISAQIVALADVYDALTSDRVYKKAFSHEMAVKMIIDGKCGAFNPLLMECLSDMADTLETELSNGLSASINQREIWNATQKMLYNEELIVSERSLRLLDYERMKYNFFASMADEIQFEYTQSPPMLTLSGLDAQKLGLDEVVMDPSHNEDIARILGGDTWAKLCSLLHSTSPAHPLVKYECKLHYNNQDRWHRIITRAIWLENEPPEFTGAIGKAVDIHDSQTKMEDLERRAAHDELTGLLNHAYAKERILKRMEECPGGQFALVICDLDHFKSANDNYGHYFGDCVLKHIASKLCQNTRETDIVARVGGDEFLFFLEYADEIEPVIKRIFNSMTGTYEEFPISVSMGVAQANAVGFSYDALFHAADQALYSAKRNGRKQYCFYNDSMKDMFSVISSIDSNNDEEI